VREWAAVRGIRAVIVSLNRGYVALPAETRRVWWQGILLGAVLVMALTVALVAGTRALESAGLLAWEEGALRWLDRAAPISFSTAMWLEGVGNGFVLWALVLYAAAMSARARLPLQALSFLVGHTLIYAFIAAGWAMWSRQRPTAILEGMAAPGGSFHAFPSGHMAQSGFAFGLLLWLWLRRATAPVERAAALLGYFLLMGIIALGRLRIGVHWPSDVAAGALIGGGWALAVAAATARAGRQVHQPSR